MRQFKVYRSNLPGLTNKGGSRISSAVLHQHAMTRHGRGGTAGDTLSPSTTMSPLTLSPSSSMSFPTDTNDSGVDVLGGNSESGSRRASFYGNGSTLSKAEQEDEIFKLLQRQTASALKGEKHPHAITTHDDNSTKGKHGDGNNLPTSYDVATLQFS